MTDEIVIQKCRTEVMSLELTDESGNAYTMGSSEKLTFSFKSRNNEKSKYSITGAAGSATITIPATGTNSIPTSIAAGIYVFDITLTKGTNVYPVIQLGKLVLLDYVSSEVG